MAIEEDEAGASSTSHGAGTSCCTCVYVPSHQLTWFGAQTPVERRLSSWKGPLWHFHLSWWEGLDWVKLDGSINRSIAGHVDRLILLMHNIYIYVYIYIYCTCIYPYIVYTHGCCIDCCIIHATRDTHVRHSVTALSSCSRDESYVLRRCAPSPIRSLQGNYPGSCVKWNRFHVKGSFGTWKKGKPKGTRPLWFWVSELKHRPRPCGPCRIEGSAGSWNFHSGRSVSDLIVTGVWAILLQKKWFSCFAQSAEWTPSIFWDHFRGRESSLINLFGQSTQEVRIRKLPVPLESGGGFGGPRAATRTSAFDRAG